MIPITITLHRYIFLIGHWTTERTWNIDTLLGHGYNHCMGSRYFFVGEIK